MLNGTDRIAVNDAPQDLCKPVCRGTAWAVSLSKGKATMKKIDVEKDYKRTKFLIVAMIVQIVVVFVCLFIYYAWLRS